MFLVLTSVVLVGSLASGFEDSKADARRLVETVEELQRPIQDFRCEFEGTIRFKKAAEAQKLGEDGLSDAFSGLFIWKRGGDTRSETFHRREPARTLMRETLVIRVSDRQAEHYFQSDDAPLGPVVIKTPKEVNSWDPACLGLIFLIDKLKRDLADDQTIARVGEDHIDDRLFKILDIGLKGLPDFPITRYWIDLGRSGQVVRQDAHGPGGVVIGRLDVELARFEVGGTEVWMPIAGKDVGYGYMDGGKPLFSNEPTVLINMKVVAGTMEFNKHPGREVFTRKYRPGTPVSDQLRKLAYEFGQQKINAHPSKLEAEKMLNEQLAQAEAQKAELVVASPSEAFDWTRWLTWGFGALVLVSSVLLWTQRRGR
jgi:hypothetical protein